MKQISTFLSGLQGQLSIFLIGLFIKEYMSILSIFNFHHNVLKGIKKKDEVEGYFVGDKKTMYLLDAYKNNDPEMMECMNQDFITFRMAYDLFHKMKKKYWRHNEEMSVNINYSSTNVYDTTVKNETYNYAPTNISQTNYTSNKTENNVIVKDRQVNVNQVEILKDFAKEKYIETKNDISKIKPVIFAVVLYQVFVKCKLNTSYTDKEFCNIINAILDKKERFTETAFNNNKNNYIKGGKGGNSRKIQHMVKQYLDVWVTELSSRLCL